MRHAAVACLVIALVVAVVVGLPYGIRSAYTSAAQRASADRGNLRGARAFPVVLGRAEGCVVCHAGMTGFSPAHDPAVIGCASCHAGNAATIDKGLAHRGLVLIPGNLADAQQSCGATQCHPEQIDRVNRSIMTSMAGVITVDRAVFGESDPSRAPSHVATLGRTPADSHLRQLCASCHLGAPKTTLGPVPDDSRGGGCNACHLNYSAGALRALRAYEHTAGRANREVPSEHPALSVNIGNEHCFGCHSRSGRISTNYEGWMERAAEAATSSATGATRTLEDGRVFTTAEPDVHFTQQLACVDCHTSREVMGDGVTHARKSEQSEVACTDCHVVGALATIRPTQLDAESSRILSLRPQPLDGRQFLTARATGTPLLNAYVDAGGAPTLSLKLRGGVRPLRRPAAVCVEGGGHRRLSCDSCHTPWAPRCSSCHTALDPRATAIDLLTGRDTKGEWVETGGDYRAAPPTLGIRIVKRANGAETATVDTFVPGMILTVAQGGRGVAFSRLYARASSHTTSRVGRSCESCHNTSEALGYGRGVLTYTPDGDRGRWTFAPAVPRSIADGLPGDAWIPFLGSRTGAVSTRNDVRPFTVAEQRAILTVGACLTCHAGSTRVMRDAKRDWRATVARVTRQCRLPVWDGSPQRP